MTIVLVLLIIGGAGAVAFALIRGLHAFANMRPTELDKDGIPQSLALQNKMMFSRVKWQAITVMLVVVLLLVAGSQ
ncbi:MAG: HIG1 domain-containing protein [Sphingorhabdus sp.]|jgi:Hypoxia induced protein conserved region|uniref:HIG1 domain-containing protein n=1 Tax=Sphingorhabdus sp. TaxID=1902408 RepID=UPI0038FCE6EC